MAETQSKQDIYEEILPQISSVIEGEDNLIANLANIVAIVHEAFDHLWTGFYFMDGDSLVLGPFQGPVACTRIPLRPIVRGVCGASATEQVTFVVPNVDEFPGHIACSSASRSEIVIPLIGKESQTELVLDIDSVELDHFCSIDQEYCERIIELVRIKHYFLT